MNSKIIFVTALMTALAQSQPLNVASPPPATGAPQIIVVTPPERQALLGALGSILSPLLTSIVRPIFTNLASGLVSALNGTYDGPDGPFTQFAALPANAEDFNWNQFNSHENFYDAFLIQTADDRLDEPTYDALSPQEAAASPLGTPSSEKRPRIVHFGRVRLIPSPNALGLTFPLKHNDFPNPEIAI